MWERVSVVLSSCFNQNSHAFHCVKTGPKLTFVVFNSLPFCSLKLLPEFKIEPVASYEKSLAAH